MKYLLKIIITIFLLSFFSCKHKPKHEEDLKLYVTIELQTKAVTNLVKEFSPQLLKFLKNYFSSNKNITAEEFALFKKSYFNLIKQIDERSSIVKELKPSSDGVMLKFFADNVIKDVSRLLLDISFFTVNRSASLTPKGILLKKLIIKSKYELLMIDANSYMKWSDKFKLEHHITQSELSKYTL